jgi:glutathione peroxidase
MVFLIFVFSIFVLSKTFRVTFRQSDKIEVNGKHENPLYVWLKAQRGGIGGAKIKWSFKKFLINRKNEFTTLYTFSKTPAALESGIIRLLEEQV